MRGKLKFDTLILSTIITYIRPQNMKRRKNNRKQPVAQTTITIESHGINTGKTWMLKIENFRYR